MEKLKFIELESASPERRTTDFPSFEKSYRAEITNVYPLTAHERLYQIQIIDPEERHRFCFQPGQFVMLEVPGVGDAPFSISSSPNSHGSLELCIRGVGNLTNFLARLPRGSQVGVSGPFGSSFPVEAMHGQNVLLLAGGLGIAPLRSPALHILENRSRYEQVELIYGAKKPSELLFTYLYQTWGQFDINLNIIVEQADPSWNGPVGMITAILGERIAALGAEALAQQTYAIVCGPPVMFKFVCKQLIEAGMPMHKIFVSLERRMHCGRGKCCRCNVGSTYTCLEGPVFDYWSIMNLKEAI